MTETEWLACADPAPMLDFLRGKASDRKLRLFAVACCRSIWGHIVDGPSRKAVEVAEQFADGLATDNELLTARDAAYEYAKRLQDGRWAAYAAWNAADNQGGALGAAAYTVWNASPNVLPIGGSERGRQQYRLLHCIIGTTARPSPPLPAAVLAWSDGTVRRLAQGIYEDRQMPAGTLHNARLAILADALLDAGCEDEGLIAHCRCPGPHGRGCWAIDAILGKC